MKLTDGKALVGKVMAIGLVAGAMAFAAPARAQAQGFAVGVQFGPAFRYDGRRDVYAQERYERERAEIARQEAWQRHEAFEQHERWEQREQQRDFNRDRGAYGYNAPRGYYGR